MEVLLTFFEQLVLPFGVLLPIRSLRIGAATQRHEALWQTTLKRMKLCLLCLLDSNS